MVDDLDVGYDYDVSIIQLLFLKPYESREN